jgi:hypothetical protein
MLFKYRDTTILFVCLCPLVPCYGDAIAFVAGVNGKWRKRRGHDLRQRGERKRAKLNHLRERRLEPA